jgi:hypothetical protein
LPPVRVEPFLYHYYEGQADASELAAAVECQESTVINDTPSQRDTKEDLENDTMLMPIKAKQIRREQVS